ncbi:MAG: DUF1552 domain-containing protein [Alphaproteobacteria bacterium]|nr:DUF1552 domain-containing protein [Alphaproteobacteria bacterium]
MRTIDRRTLLRGLFGGAAVSVALPPLACLLDSHGTAWADGTAFPRRFLQWTWGDGVVPARWVPSTTGAGADWVLSDALAPLVDHKARLAVLSGLEVKAPDKAVPHWSGFMPLLTGEPLQGVDDDFTPVAPTLDQRVATEIAGTTPFRSLELGALDDTPVSYNGTYSPNPPERDPVALYDRLFGPTFRDPADADAPLDPSLALRQSLLDVVGGHVTDLQRSLGADDRARLDQHLTGLRDLELRLARLAEGPADLAACRRPSAPADATGLTDPFARHAALVDVLSLALACDLTRVATMCFLPPVNPYQFPGTPDAHHQLTHSEAGEQPLVHATTVRTMEAFATFLDALAAVPEGDGSVLDHALVLATTDCAHGQVHAYTDWPVLLAGGADGALRTDRHVRSAGGNASAVALTVMHALGLRAPSFGSGDLRVTAPVTDVLG